MTPFTQPTAFQDAIGAIEAEIAHYSHPDERAAYLQQSAATLLKYHVDSFHIPLSALKLAHDDNEGEL